MLTRRDQLGVGKGDGEGKEQKTRGRKRQAKAKAAPKAKGNKSTPDEEVGEDKPKKRGRKTAQPKTGEQEEGAEGEEEPDKTKEAKPRIPTSKVIIAVKGCLEVARKDPAKWHHVEILFNAVSTEVTPENLIKYKNWGLSMYWGKGSRPTQRREAYSFFLQPLRYFNQFAIESGESLCGSFLCECPFSPNSFWNTLYFIQNTSLQGQIFTAVLDCWTVVSRQNRPKS